MTNPPLISIITPTFNASATLVQCIESVQGQTYKHIEHLFIDGLSSDKTIELLKSYSAKYPNIKYLSEKDNGVYDAMNKGVLQAKGDWIYFLGSDDSFYSTEILAQVFQSGVNMETDVIYGNVTSPRFGGVYDGEFTYEKIINKNICHQAIFFARSLFDKIGNMDTKYAILSDWEFNLRWFLDSNIKRKFINLVIANYSDGGLSSIGRPDAEFENDYRPLCAKYGKNSLSLSKRAELFGDQALIDIDKFKFLRSISNLTYSMSCSFLRGRYLKMYLLYFKNLIKRSINA